MLMLFIIYLNKKKGFGKLFDKFNLILCKTKCVCKFNLFENILR